MNPAVYLQYSLSFQLIFLISALYTMMSVNMMVANWWIDSDISELFYKKMIIPAHEISVSFCEMTLIGLEATIKEGKTYY
jgi:hypothetical protein